MRIAISGAHCCGKSTLIEAFLACHSNYVHEPEAYEALQDLHGEFFSAEPSSDDLLRQLEYHSQRWRDFGEGDCVVVERSPVDYLAYLQTFAKLRREPTNPQLIDQSIQIVQTTLQRIDVLVFLPATGEVPEDEDPELRSVVSARLEKILLDDEYGWFSGNSPIVLEASGSTSERLRILETALSIN
jgi:hypothetical protein